MCQGKTTYYHTQFHVLTSFQNMLYVQQSFCCLPDTIASSTVSHFHVLSNLLSWWGRESWLLCLICLPGVSWWLSGSSSQCHGVVCGLWLWYFLIILTIFRAYGPQCKKTWLSCMKTTKVQARLSTFVIHYLESAIVKLAQIKISIF